MWAWLAIVAVALIGWRIYSSRKAASTPASTDSGVPASDVPQFVNQTYTTVTAPVTPPQPVTQSPQPVINYGFRPVPPGPQRLQRTWTAPTGGVSTLAQVAQRLTGRADPALLTPANRIAQQFVAGPFKRNRNAKVPRGATFTYEEGLVVTDRGPQSAGGPIPTDRGPRAAA